MVRSLKRDDDEEAQEDDESFEALLTDAPTAVGMANGQRYPDSDAD